MKETLYLIHHGIKGMKWGVRRYQNPDGTLTAEGQKRYASGLKEYYNKNHGYDDNSLNYDPESMSVFNKYLASNSESRDNYKKAEEDYTKLTKDYDNNVEQYQDLAAGLAVMTKEWSDTATINDISMLASQFRYGDLDQGYGNSLAVYAIDKGKYKEVSNAAYNLIDARETYEASNKKIAQDILGKYGESTVGSGWSKKKISDRLAEDLVNKLTNDDALYSAYSFDEGSRSDKEIKDDKKKIDYLKYVYSDLKSKGIELGRDYDESNPLMNRDIWDYFKK